MTQRSRTYRNFRTRTIGESARRGTACDRASAVPGRATAIDFVGKRLGHGRADDGLDLLAQGRGELAAVVQEHAGDRLPQPPIEREIDALHDALDECILRLAIDARLG